MEDRSVVSWKEIKEGIIYKKIFHGLNLSVWETDLSGAREYLLAIRQEAGRGMRDYLDKHPELMKEVISRIRFLDANEFSTRLFRAENQEILFSSFPRIMAPESWPALVDFAVAIAEGDLQVNLECTLASLDGHKLPVVIRAYLHAGDFNYSQSLWVMLDIEAQKDAEEEFKRSEERLRTILKAIPDLIFLFDRDGYYLDFYASDHSRLVLPADSIIGNHISDVFQPDIAAKATDAFHKCLENNEIQYIQYEIDLPDGHFYYEARIVPAGDHELIVLAMDITGRELAQQALIKSEQHYRHLINHANDAILIIEPATEMILDANPRASDLYGFSKDELLGLSLRDLTKNVKRGREQIYNALINNEFKNFETIHYHKCGLEINILVNGSLIEHEGKKAILIINHDITDLKKAERSRNATYQISELALSCNSMDELYRSIHNIIEGLMPARNIYVALYDQDVNMLSFPYFMDEHDVPPPPRRLKRGLTEYVLRTAKPVLTNPALIKELLARKEIEIIGTFTYDWMGVPLKTKDRMIGVLVVQSYDKDIRYTDADKEILIFVSEQVAMAIDRWIKEEELRKAKETAEESSKLKSTLLANLSHEFRTPMNGILNYSRILRERLGEDSMIEMADTIYSSGRRLLATLDSIMYLAQIEASNIKLDVKKIDVSKELQTTLLSFESEASHKGLNYHHEVREEVHAYGDVTLVNQIVKYLLDNAIKFTPQGGILVRISSVQLGGKLWAEVEVKDSGVGIAKKDIEVIFHEFRQLSSGYGRSHEGSGLGLTLSKKMAELMNGRIIVESAVGKGSSFFLRLPQAKDFYATALPAVPAPAARTHHVSTPARDKTNLPEILIVEDNLVNMELTVMFLKEICLTDKARDGLTAIRMAGMKQYSAILMDINLGPGINGLEAALEIRKIPGYQDIPIVAVTGYTMSGDREKMLLGGCSHYLPKPFDKKGIVKMVNDVLNASPIEI